MIWLYRLWVIGAVGLFAYSSTMGWRFTTAPAQHIPPSVRSSPGGYRSYHFWHTGFSGGK